MQKVWLVTGTSGEYSDTTEWPVAVYLDAESAREHARRAQKAAEALKDIHWEEREFWKNPYDPDMELVSLPVEYFVNEVDLAACLDEWLDFHGHKETA